MPHSTSDQCPLPEHARKAAQPVIVLIFEQCVPRCLWLGLKRCSLGRSGKTTSKWSAQVMYEYHFPSQVQSTYTDSGRWFCDLHVFWGMQGQHAQMNEFVCIWATKDGAIGASVTGAVPVRPFSTIPQFRDGSDPKQDWKVRDHLCLEPYRMKQAWLQKVLMRLG